MGDGFRPWEYSGVGPLSAEALPESNAESTEDASGADTSAPSGVTIAVEPVTAAAVSLPPAADAEPAAPPLTDDAQALIVLTRESGLIETVRAGSGTHSLVVVSDEAELASRLIGAHAGVALIDAAAVSGGMTTLVERLRIQFPDLVLIVAGTAGDQADVAGKVTDGTVHRFLHKPVSPQRIKLFVDAAWRRHDEEHLASTRTMKALSEAPPPQKRSQLPVVLGAAAAVALVVGLWLAYRPGEPASQPLAQAKVVPGAADAKGAALDKLLDDAEKSLLAGNVDAASQAVDSARKLGPNNVRVVFLDAQIAKERERAVLTQARQAAAGGNLAGALAVLDGASRDGPKSAVVSQTRDEMEQRQLDERVKSFLSKADSHISSGALLEPAQNNARFFIESARALSPRDPGILRLQQRLGDRLADQARKAIGSGKLEDAERLVDAAQEPYVDATTVASLKREVQRLRVSSSADSVTRVMTAFNERMARGALVEPEGDSAKSYLAELSKLAADHPATQLARQSYTGRVLAAASDAISHRDAEQARRWLAEARAAGAAAPELSAIERDIAQIPAAGSAAGAVAPGAAPAAAPTASGSVVQSTALKRTRYVEPRFPADAERAGVSGWVDLEFDVLPTGRVSDVKVIGSQPAKTFDSAAADALKRWQFAPVIRDGQPITQRSKVRIRFQAG